MEFFAQVGNPIGVQGMIMARRMNQNHAGLVSWAVERMGIPHVQRLLDLGCGGGGALCILSARIEADEYIALDPSRSMVRMTSKVNRHLERNGTLEGVVGSVTGLPFREGAFDMVFACETTYFWPDLGTNLIECARVLGCGGTIVLVQETWDAPEWEERNRSWQKGFSMTFHSLEGYRSLLTESGFKDIRTEVDEHEGWFIMIGTKAV